MNAIIFFMQNSNRLRFRRQINRVGWDFEAIDNLSLEMSIDEDDIVSLKRDINTVARKVGASPFSTNLGPL